MPARRPNIFHDLSGRSRVFRGKLIEEFRLTEAHGPGGEGGENAPTFISSEMETEPERFRKMLRDNPGQLVKFKIFKRSQFRTNREKMDKRLTRMRNINSLPIGVWAGWVVKHRYFALSINLMILINAIILGLQSELSSESYPETNKVLSMIDLTILIFFMLEILLKWLDSFERFWANRWDWFDFFITVASIVPEIILFFPSDDPQQANRISGIAKNLRILRTLRTLKAIVRFGSLRVIVHTILDAFQSMTFILVTLLMVTYIVSIFGIHLFEEYTLSDVEGLQYQEKFKNIAEALLTLFQLLSLDQWYAIQRDISRVVSPAVTGIYFIVWVWLGAMIFRNVFVGVMVAKFQALSEMLAKEDEENKKRRKLERLGQQLHNTLQNVVKKKDAGPGAPPVKPAPAGSAGANPGASGSKKGGDLLDPASSASGKRGKQQQQQQQQGEEGGNKGSMDVPKNHSRDQGQGRSPKGDDDTAERSAMTPRSSASTLVSRNTLVSSDEGWSSGDQLRSLQSLLVQSSPDAAAWEATVGKTMQGLMASKTETMWPRDTLFTYLQTMESLQENLREYEELQLLSAYAIHTMHDT